MFSKNIFRAEVRGTANIMPTMPHMYPQKINDIKMTMGERLRLLPVIRGSMALPMTNCVAINPMAINNTFMENPNFNMLISMGKAVAMMDPKLGMKFKTKINSAENITKSIPAINKITALIKPVTKLIKDFINR